jgi:hypothetical protein
VFRSLIHGFASGLASFVLLVIAMSLSMSIEFAGHCGFLRSTCGYLSYLLDIVSWNTLLYAFLLPLIQVVTIAVSFVARRRGWPRRWQWLMICAATLVVGFVAGVTLL